MKLWIDPVGANAYIGPGGCVSIRPDKWGVKAYCFP